MTGEHNVSSVVHQLQHLTAEEKVGIKLRERERERERVIRSRVGWVKLDAKDPRFVCLRESVVLNLSRRDPLIARENFDLRVKCEIQEGEWWKRAKGTWLTWVTGRASCITALSANVSRSLGDM